MGLRRADSRVGGDLKRGERALEQVSSIAVEVGASQPGDERAGRCPV